MIYFYIMTICIESTIDKEIIIVEKVENKVYDYVHNIIEKYSLMPLRIVMKITGPDWFLEVELYDNSGQVASFFSPIKMLAPQNATSEITDTLKGFLTQWYQNVDSALKASEKYNKKHSVEKTV